MDSTTATTRRPCFIEEDDGLASIADMEAAGFSGNHHNLHHHQQHYPVISRPFYYTAFLQRRNSLRNISSPTAAAMSSPRSAFFGFEEQPHFLEACFLCKKPLGGNKDIFMYRGDTPFCSEECRQEQIEMDEAKEKSYNLSASMKALRKKDQKKSASPSQTAQDYSFRPGTTVAAA